MKEAIEARRALRNVTTFTPATLAALTAAILSCAASTAGHAPFKISRATTYLTAPVLPSGRVDYIAAINAWAKRGVTTKNNAGALLAKTLKLHAMGAGFQGRFYKSLGIGIPKRSDEYRHWYDYAQRHFLPRGVKPYAGQAGALFVKSASATMHPWTTAQYPKVAAWLKAIGPALRLLLRASRRSQFYMPMLARHGGSVPIYILLPNLSVQESEGQALVRLAMHAVAEKHANLAANALLASCRLAALASRQPMGISSLVSYVDSEVAIRAVGYLLAHHDLHKPQEQLLLRGLQREPAIASLIPAANFDARCSVLGAVEQLATSHGRGFVQAVVAEGGSGGKLAGWPNVETSREKKFFALVRWNRVLEGVNRISDQNVAALREPGYIRQKLALQSLASRIKMDHVSLAQPPWTAAPLGPRADTNVILNFYITALHGNPLKVLQFRDDAILQQRAVEITLALAIYHADYHAYPGTLAALTPKLVRRPLNDPFTGKSMSYRQRGAGYVLQARSPVHGRQRPRIDAHSYLLIVHGGA